MFSGSLNAAGRHNVCRRVDPPTLCHGARKDPVKCAVVIGPGMDWTDDGFKELPGIDPVEELKQDCPKEEGVMVLRPIRLDVTHQKLAYAVGDAVHIRETKTKENWVGA